jgi:hypothetical protein
MQSKRIGAGIWLGRLSRLLAAGGLASLAIHGCSSSSDERKRASELAGGCAINSDCDPELICAFERCHKQCTEDRDCLADLRCVKSEVSDVFVCQLEEETECSVDKDCPGDQVCGVDDECRDSCKEEDDCVGAQVCANSGECASTAPGKDQLDAEGNLIPDDASAPGAGGNGSDPSGGTGGTDSGGSGAMSSGGVAGMVDGGGQPSSGGVGDAGATAGPDGELDYEETPTARKTSRTTSARTRFRFRPRSASTWLKRRARLTASTTTGSRSRSRTMARRTSSASSSSKTRACGPSSRWRPEKTSILSAARA